MKNNVYLQNYFFCRTRTLDIYRIEKYISDNGYKIVNNPKLADYIILSTCGTVDKSTEKSIKQIKDMQKYKAELIVVGCLPDTDKDLMDNIFSGTYIRNVELNQIDKIFERGYLYKNYEMIQMEPEDGEISIEICRGCRESCSYCAIRRAVGDIQSMPLDICVNLIQNAVDNGMKRIVLGAENTGAYGYDINLDLSSLLSKIKFTERSRALRLNNLHPKYFVENFEIISELASKGIIGLLKIPIQSGSQKIINLMRRNYKLTEFANCIRLLKKIDSSIIYMTDIIIGFPGEVFEDVNETMDYVHEFFDIGRIFLFTPKNNTHAATLVDKVSNVEKEKILQTVLDDLKRRNMIININDDLIHTFCCNISLLDLENPYTEGIFQLFSGKKMK